jgi:hypothetical protein
MDEIFDNWLTSQEHADAMKTQGDTVVLTWTPGLSRLQALRALLLGRRRTRVNIATIKVKRSSSTGAWIVIYQQPDFETTEPELLDALAAGRSEKLEAELSSQKKLLDDLAARGRQRLEMRPDCGDTLAPAGWWCTRLLGHDGPCAMRRIEGGVDPR